MPDCYFQHCSTHCQIKNLRSMSVLFIWFLSTTWTTHDVRSISPRSIQLSPVGSELGWGLLADQSESRKFLCPNMERLCAALKSAAKIHVQCFAKIYSSISRLCDNQSLQSHLLGSKNDKKNIESSSCSKEGCLQSIERLKAQPASRQWDLHVTSGDHFEAAKSCTTQTFYTMFL